QRAFRGRLPIHSRFRNPIWIGILRHAIGPKATFIHAGVLPELACDLERVDTDPLPPYSLVAGAMNGAVMQAAQRDSEFVAGPAAKRARLDVSKMVRVRWFAAADETGLSRDVAQVHPVAV